MSKAFPKEKFLEELNKTEFTLKNNEKRVLNDWIKTFEDSRNLHSMRFESSKFNFYLEINDIRIVDCICYVPKKEFLDTLKNLFETIRFDCLLVTKERKLIPMTKKAKEMFSWFEPFLPITTVYHGSNYAYIKIPHLRIELIPEFDYENKKIDLYYSNHVIGSLTSKSDAEDFLKLWMSRSKIIDDIYEDAYQYCRRYDLAAFKDKRSSGTIYVFEEELRLGFSYYLKDGKLYYFMTHFSHVLKRLEEDFITDMDYLKQTSLDYVKKFIDLSKTKAAIERKTNNYFFKVCTDVFGYPTNFEDYYHSKIPYDMAKNYVNENFDKYQLEKATGINIPELNRIFVDEKNTLDGVVEFEDEINEVYEFGVYIFILGDRDTHTPFIFMLEKDELKKLLPINC